MRLLPLSIYLLIAPLLSLFPATAAAAHDKDSAAVVQTIERFHSALAAGDSASVKTILSGDVIVLESGFLETRAEYIDHHLGADIEFARAVPSQRKVVRVTHSGNTAWVTSTSTTAGNFKGRAINSQGTELMVLTRINGEWKIRAIHWSSARRQG